ncbi:MAG: hypothetical protein ACP5GZ_01710 [Vulcanisaeta sp.]|uniref:hypothetical protein n=1 Tax=Vulcanisaeta sp. TaxID=2020871 RepID=UPI003D0A3D09
MSKEESRRDVEVIKVELPRDLAERYGFRRDVLSRTVADLIARELGMRSGSSGTVDSIVGIGLQSDFQWDGEDLIEALRRRMDVSDRR